MRQGEHRPIPRPVLDGVPILKAFLTAANPLGAAFAQLIEKSRSFKDIQEVLNNLFQVLANIFDSIFLPVVRVLAQGLTFVANGFIALYNTIGSLLSIFGIHIERLNYINSLLGNLDAGLITVTHDLPTLKQNVSGQTGGLSAAAGGPDGSTDPFTESINQQTSVQTSWFSRIVGFLSVLAGIDWLTHGKFVSSMGGFFNQLGGKIDVGLGEVTLGVALLNSHATGIIGVIEKVIGVLITIQGILTVIAGANQAGGLGAIFAGILGGGAASGGIFGSAAGIDEIVGAAALSSSRRGVGSQSGEASGSARSLTDNVVATLVDAINTNTAAIQLATGAATRPSSGVSGLPVKLHDDTINKLANKIGSKVGSSTTNVGVSGGSVSLKQLQDLLGRNQSIQSRTQRSAYTT